MIKHAPLDIKGVQEELLSKKYTLVDLVDFYLDRIKRLNPNLNAYITVSDESAYKRAKEMDRVIANKGKMAFIEHPLLGAVFGLKDLFLTKGIRTTAASKLLENFVPPYSATSVEKLDAAGAVMIGKTNCDAWAHGGSGENSDFGPTKNPWNQKYVPGGSSSGSAVSVASDLSLCAMGTDTGGSIRQPAGFCGVVGFKPTYGAVSRYGVIAMSSSLDTVGHFTKTVSDSKAVFGVTKGEDGRDSTVINSPTKEPLKKLRIGIPKEYFIEGLDREVERAVLSSTEVFKNLGHEIVDISLPHTKHAISVYYIIQPAEVSSNLSRYDAVRFGNERNTFSAEAKRRIMLGTYVLSAGYFDAYYLKAMKVRSLLISDFEKAFEKVDAILSPVSPTTAFLIGEKSKDPLSMYLADVFTVAANLAGIPGLSLPCGFSKDNLPIGMQLLGDRFGEETLFALGEQFQEKTNFHLQKPKL